jgi:hypothetical protein
MAVYTELQGFSNIAQSSQTELMESSLVMFFDWGFINKGAFYNVRIPSSGQYGGNRHQLRYVKDQNFQDGQVWEAFRNNWVWQSGLSTSQQPIQVSGVYVNGAYYPLSTVGTYAHTVDYNNGRIIFNSPIPTGTTVSCEYTYKWINVINADKIPWFAEVQYNSLRRDSPQFNLPMSGDWFGLAQTRLQMPIVAIEMSQGGYTEPYALGGGQWVYRRGIFNIFTEDEQTAKKLADIVSTQDDRSIFEIDLDTVAAHNAFPLTAGGAIASGALTYPQMVEAYKWNQIRFKEFEIQKTNRLNPRLYHTTISILLETVLPQIP